MVRAFPVSAKVVALVLILFIIVFMLLPLVVVVGAALSSSQFVAFPPDGFSLRWFQAALTSDRYMTPALVSLTVAAIVTVLAVVVGTAAAIALTRFRFPGSDLISTFFLSPLVLPTIILGIGLLLFTSNIGTGPNLAALVVGHLLIAVPYVIRTVSAVLAGSDRFAEEAARTMGARWYERYWFVVLPQCLPGIVAGAFFAFNISFDEAVIALFLRSPDMITLPIQVYSELEFSTSPTVAAVSSMMIFLTIILIIAIERFLGIKSVVG